MKTKGTRYENLPGGITADCFRDGSVQLHVGDNVESYPASAFVSNSGAPDLLIASLYPEARIGRESLGQYAERVGKLSSSIIG